MKKKAYELTHQEAKSICDRQRDCVGCPLMVTNGCLRSVAGFTKEEINKKVEVNNYGD